MDTSKKKNSRAEPLANGGHHAGQQALHVLNIVELWCPSVFPVDHDDLPVCLVYSKQHTAAAGAAASSNGIGREQGAEVAAASGHRTVKQSDNAKIIRQWCVWKRGVGRGQTGGGMAATLQVCTYIRVSNVESAKKHGWKTMRATTRYKSLCRVRICSFAFHSASCSYPYPHFLVIVQVRFVIPHAVYDHRHRQQQR